MGQKTTFSSKSPLFSTSWLELLRWKCEQTWKPFVLCVPGPWLHSECISACSKQSVKCWWTVADINLLWVVVSCQFYNAARMTWSKHEWHDSEFVFLQLLSTLINHQHILSTTTEFVGESAEDVCHAEGYFIWNQAWCCDRTINSTSKMLSRWIYIKISLNEKLWTFRHQRHDLTQTFLTLIIAY